MVKKLNNMSLEIKLNNVETNILNAHLANPTEGVLDKHNIKKLIIYYFKTFDKVTFPLEEADFYKATSPETIVRSRRKVRVYLKMNDKKTEEAEEEHTSYYRDKNCA